MTHMLQFLAIWCIIVIVISAIIVLSLDFRDLSGLVLSVGGILVLFAVVLGCYLKSKQLVNNPYVPPGSGYIAPVEIEQPNPNSTQFIWPIIEPR